MRRSIASWGAGRQVSRKLSTPVIRPRIRRIALPAIGIFTHGRSHNGRTDFYVLPAPRALAASSARLRQRVVEDGVARKTL